MSFFSLIFAFLAEQVRPLSDSSFALRFAERWRLWLSSTFDAGSKPAAYLSWVLAVLLPSVVLTCIAGLLLDLHPVFALVFHVFILWCCLGFRDALDRYKAIELAVARNDLAEAAEQVQAWLARQGVLAQTPARLEAICRATLEAGIVAAHRHLFAVIFWYAILPGPFGAIFYALAAQAQLQWGARNDALGQVSRAWFALVDWVPARLTAIGFAVVGNFEDALYGWKQRAERWEDAQRGMVVESAAGALRLDLSPPNETEPATLDESVVRANHSEQQPGLSSLHQGLGLITRSLALWMGFLFLLTVVAWVS